MFNLIFKKPYEQEFWIKTAKLNSLPISFFKTPIKRFLKRNRQDQREKIEIQLWTRTIR